MFFVTFYDAGKYEISFNFIQHESQKYSNISPSMDTLSHIYIPSDKK